MTAISKQGGVASGNLRAVFLSLRTPANLVTLGRIATSPVLFWLVLRASEDGGASWWAFALGLLLGASDAWDGYLARRRADETRTGAFLDPLADKVLVLGTMFCFASLGRFGWVPVGLMTAREALISFYRIWIVRHGVVLPARYSAKWKTIIQGLPLLAALLPPLVGTRLLLPVLLWIAVAATYLTGLQYVIDARRGSARLTHAGAPGGSSAIRRGEEASPTPARDASSRSPRGESCGRREV